VKTKFETYYWKAILLSVCFLFTSFLNYGQSDSIKSKIDFNADFRFRIEQDWNSRKSDGSFRDDRTRLRYRLRAGIEYRKKWYSAGFRIRTGNPNKQQDPQLTLGEGFQEFGTLPIGLEKAYFQGQLNSTKFWMGKNTFPFEKNNELFWSDNVYPEGVFIEREFGLQSSLMNSLTLSGGHFLIAASGKSFAGDTYVQGIQAKAKTLKNKLTLFPSFYYFNKVPNIPDGSGTFLIDYSIVHLGSKIKPFNNQLFTLKFDYYINNQDYTQNDSIPSQLENQNAGIVLGLEYGQIKEKGDWQITGTYARLEQFSILDIMAQNDWARWDYSQYNSPDGRLTNFNGFEWVVAYALEDNIKLVMKYYWVEQLIPLGTAKETGSRIRLDLDIRF